MGGRREYRDRDSAIEIGICRSRDTMWKSGNKWATSNELAPLEKMAPAMSS